MATADAPPPVRDAATVILVRDPAVRPAVLMGRRGRNAAFLPSKMVFPGGALDPADRALPALPGLSPLCEARLGPLARPLAAAAIRELFEETGLVLGRPGHDDPAPGWEAFAATGHAPSAEGLAFVFRAITPPGRPRRFDARFFLADAVRLAGGPDAPLSGDGELSALDWIPLDRVARFDLPFVTECVLAEVAERLPDLGPPPRVPFFDNDDEETRFALIGGPAP